MNPQEIVHSYLPYYIQKAQFDHYFYMMIFVVMTFLMLLMTRGYRRWLKNTQIDHEFEEHVFYCVLICVFFVASITSFNIMYDSYFTYIYATKNIVDDLRPIIPSYHNWNFSVHGLK